MELGLELQPLNLPADNERPIVIAGPCSAETEEQVMKTARQLKELGCHNFVQVYGNRAPNPVASRATASRLCLGCNA